MLYMEQDNNKLHLTELILKVLFFGTLIFVTSYIITDTVHTDIVNKKIQKNDNLSNKYNQYYSNLNTETSQPKQIKNIIEPYYVIFKNADPSIKQIELFLANNQHKLSEEELANIEQLRNKKITELMAKKYVQMTADN